jgi:hypothetical protein
MRNGECLICGGDGRLEINKCENKMKYLYLLIIVFIMITYRSHGKIYNNDSYKQYYKENVYKYKNVYPDGLLNAAIKYFKEFLNDIERFEKPVGRYDGVAIEDIRLGLPLRHVIIRDTSELKNVASTNGFVYIHKKQNLWIFPIWYEKGTIGEIRFQYRNGEWDNYMSGQGNTSIEYGILRNQFPLDEGYNPIIIKLTYWINNDFYFLFNLPSFNKNNLTNIHLENSEIWFMISDNGNRYISNKNTVTKEMIYKKNYLVKDSEELIKEYINIFNKEKNKNEKWRN